MSSIVDWRWLSFLVVGFLVGCSRDDRHETLRVGVVATPQRDDAPLVGDFFLENLRTNPEQKPLGREVFLRTTTAKTPEEAAGLASRFVALNKVQVVLVQGRSAVAHKISLALHGEAVVVFASAGEAGAARENVYCLGVSPQEQARALVKVNSEQLKGAGLVVWRAPQAEYANRVAEFFLREARRTVVDVLEFPLDDKTASKMLARVPNPQPIDVLLITGSVANFIY